MNIIRSDRLPRLWWLNPWATALYLHSAATALKAYADRADLLIETQAAVIDDLQDKLSPQQTNA
jgi:hypothetical protein